MTPPTLFLTVGLPATGKTTAARQIETDYHALRLTKDEWVKALFGADNPADASDVIEGRLIAIALRTLTLGVNAILDFGLWSRDERSALRHAACEAGAVVEMRYFTAPADILRARIDTRLAATPRQTWPISDAELADWTSRFETPTTGELDGSDPIGDPPAGFATWPSWRAHRWPACRTQR